MEVYAATQGNGIAQYGLGVLYEQGRDVARDYAQAAKFIRMATENGYSEAMFRLGLLYARAKGVAMDEHEAAKLFRLAATSSPDDSE